MTKRELRLLRREWRKIKKHESYLVKIDCPTLAREVRAGAELIEQEILALEARLS